MAAIGNMIHQVTPMRSGLGVPDGRGGTEPGPAEEIATVWSTAKQLQEQRLLQFAELSISEAYEFEVYYDHRFLNASLVKFRDKLLTVHKVFDSSQEGDFLKIVAYGST